MNLILLFPEDFVEEGRVELRGRRLDHLRTTHRALVGDRLTVGIAGGKVGKGKVESIDGRGVVLAVELETDPPPPLPVTLILALPRPKVLNRVIAGVTSMGVKKIVLLNAWRVEKSYWASPRLSPANLHLQAVLGLEQGRDTVLPSIELRRLFRPFVENELPALARATRRLVAHPGAAAECPKAVGEAVTLVVGPEGGFVAAEISSLERAGFTAVTIGERVLRVETAVTALLSRLF